MEEIEVTKHLRLDEQVESFCAWNVRWLKLYGFLRSGSEWMGEYYSISVFYDYRDNVICVVLDEVQEPIIWETVEGIESPKNLSLRNQLPNVYFNLGGSIADCLIADRRIGSLADVQEVLAAYHRMLAYVVPRLQSQREVKKVLKAESTIGIGGMTW